MNILRPLFLGLLLILGTRLPAQVIRVTPIFPQANDTVTILYDATQGNGALQNVVPIYTHTGVITNLSTSPTDWRHVQGQWGTADPTVLMTPLGNNKHQIRYHIPTYYGIPGNETPTRLAFVFRNTDGSIVGRAFDGADIFYPLYPAGQLFAAIVNPEQDFILVNAGDIMDIYGAASDTATLTLTDNGTQVYQALTQEFPFSLTAGGPGTHEVILTATDGTTTVRDTFHYIVNPNTITAPLPAGTLSGLNRINPTTVRLRLDAPGKDNVYVLGNFNDYTPDSTYFMRRTPDGNTFWLDINLTAGQIYNYQYLIDGTLRTADPFAEQVLDPANDNGISSATYPNRPPYPTGKTTGIVTVLDLATPAYNWQVSNFQKPAAQDLVVYELLVRDFLAAHDYKTILDTLDYLQRLGVNAIEFMPLNEFEGNESWGYNVSFHMALDKYYGPPNTLKALIDECHARGIAVILDIVYNQAFSQSPLCQMYWDPVGFKPAPDNPWLNPDARHPFNVGYDFNHESPWTKIAFTRTVRYFLEEYRFDGFRFDLSKGFTQTNSGSDVNLWGQYDQSRINIWQAYRDSLRITSPDAYLILEHFAANNEETVLQNLGFLIWGNHNYQYNEATMGYISNSNFEWIDYKERGWANPRVMGYMESHDEERLMFKNLEFGNSIGNYNIQHLPTALRRMELAGNFFFTIPGPKMLWQFGERGYDISIDDPCRLCNKPPRWEYMNNPDRVHLYKVWSALIHLKTNYPVFTTTNYTHSLGATTKKIFLDGTDMDVAIFGNFGSNPQTFSATFPHTGMWYEYWTGDSLDVTDPGMNLSFTPGEYRLYTTDRLPLPDLAVPVGLSPTPEQATLDLQLWPNPSTGQVSLQYNLPRSGPTHLTICNLQGQPVRHILQGWQAKGDHHLDLNLTDLPAGYYLLFIRQQDTHTTQPLILQH